MSYFVTLDVVDVDLLNPVGVNRESGHFASIGPRHGFSLFNKDRLHCWNALVCK